MYGDIKNVFFSLHAKNWGYPIPWQFFKVEHFMINQSLHLGVRIAFTSYSSLDIG